MNPEKKNDEDGKGGPCSVMPVKKKEGGASEPVDGPHQLKGCLDELAPGLAPFATEV